jgi:hypothetical protein
MAQNYKDNVYFQIFTYFFSVIFFDTSLQWVAPCAGYVALSGLGWSRKSTRGYLFFKPFCFIFL